MFKCMWCRGSSSLAYCSIWCAHQAELERRKPKGSLMLRIGRRIGFY